MANVTSRMCGGCDHGMRRTDAPGAMVCRRNPPTPILVTRITKPTPQNPQGVIQTVEGYFAPVGENDACGEFSARATVIAS